MIAEKEINEQHISELLKQVNSLLEIKRRIPPVPGENFNVFSILNMERNEEETHNRLIYEFLNKDGSHGMGDVFFREFFKMVLEKNYPKGEVKVYREYSFDNGRIDILIHGDDFCYPIEMKIYAGDQPEQIKRYYEHAQKEANHKVYYLTLDGHEPSKDSLGEKLSEEMEASKKENIDNIKEKHVECISYDFHIRNWLERCSEIAWKVPSITGIIQQYIKLLDKLTGHFEEDIFMEEIKKIVGCSKENYESALAIENNLQKIRAEKMIEFFTEIETYMKGKLELLCLDYKEKATEYYEPGKRVYPHLSYLIPVRNEPKKGIKIALRFEVNYYFFFGINFYNKDNNQLKCYDVNSNDVIDAFDKEEWRKAVGKSCKSENNKGENKYWLKWMYLPSEPKRGHESSEKKNINFMTCDGLYKTLFNPKEHEERKDLMESIFKMINNQLDSIRNTGLLND